MIFISTGGFYSRSAIESVSELLQYGIKEVELSGGKYSETQETELIKLRDKLQLQVHNYFPPPKESFVFNLASADKDLSERSVQHVQSAMRLAVDLGRPVYSFHAGFRINPATSELGQRLKKRKLCDRTTALKIFRKNVLMLASEAEKLGVTLLIENNVLSATNFSVFNEDPLLLTNPDEIVSFMQDMPDNVRLLLDVAHLKVSANTLGFNLIDAHAQMEPWIQGYHLSDNDGLEDSNQVVTEDSWFWDIINPNLDYYTLEIYRVPCSELVCQYELVKNKLLSKRIISEKVL